MRESHRLRLKDKKLLTISKLAHAKKCLFNKLLLLIIPIFGKDYDHCLALVRRLLHDILVNVPEAIRLRMCWNVLE